MFKKYVAALALLFPLASHAAYQVDMSCSASIKDFFGPLVQQGVIVSKPNQVNPDTSVNLFSLSPGQQVTLYGIPVVAVFGFADDPLLFIRKSNATGYNYGVIVKVKVADVRAQLDAFGATKARAALVNDDLTAIGCEGA